MMSNHDHNMFASMAAMLDGQHTRLPFRSLWLVLLHGVGSLAQLRVEGDELFLPNGGSVSE